MLLIRCKREFGKGRLQLATERQFLMDDTTVHWNLDRPCLNHNGHADNDDNTFGDGMQSNNSKNTMPSIALKQDGDEASASRTPIPVVIDDHPPPAYERPALIS